MKKDLSLKTFFSDDRRFADVINGFCCNGEQRVRPEDLHELDSAEVISEVDSNFSKSTERKRKMRGTNRDTIRKVAFGVNFAIVGIENQEEEDYSLPYRIMSYDVSRYGKQVAEIKRDVKAEKEGKADRDKREKLNAGEFLYDFRKDSRLHPVVTFVLYYGKNKYDGATDLHGIIDFTDVPEYIKHMVQNYQVNLIDIRRYENFDMLHTDVKTVFELIRHSGDTEKWNKIAQDNVWLDKDALEVVAAYTNMKDVDKIIAKYETEKGEINMCKAWDDRLAEGRELGRTEGRELGRTEGRELGRRSMVVEFIRDGLVSVADAAKQLGITQEEIQRYMEEEDCAVSTVA